jgi:ribonucleoside-diphosphate reductase alpha chain
MKVFNATSEYVKYGGKRRGANMGILNVDHPDIEEFIGAKRQEGFLYNFNLSVGISESFMQAVELDKLWNLIHPKTGNPVKTLSARLLWESIVENAWLSGDPGLIFLDTINARKPLPASGKIECTNPCGEAPLLPNESCNLGSIYLTQFVTTDRTVDWLALANVVQAAIRFLDNVIEINDYTLPEMKFIVQRNRKVGLGVMG